MKYHNLCSVHRRSILDAARKTSIGELFGTRDSYERRTKVLAFVEAVTAHTISGNLPARVAAEIFPLTRFHHYDDIGVYSEILAAHSEMIADERNILDGDELDREVAAFA